jgi:uncharacterized protein (DUF362 family)
MSGERKVVAYRAPGLQYPDAAPFDPGVHYPEYPFGRDAVGPNNPVYEAVRTVLHMAGLDDQRFGTADWNPFASLVRQGGTVLIKPNWVRHYHLRGLDIFSIVTHPAVLRPLIDYAFKAVGPSGRIYLMDAPQFDSDFTVLSSRCQLEHLASTLRARSVPLFVADLRSLVVHMDKGVVVKRVKRACWESEGVEFDLGDDSELAELGGSLHNIFGSDYDRRATVSCHRPRRDGGQRHCYRISRRVLEADLVISVPKLKTHKKTGVTLNVKNMIGINTDKNYIAHYRVGSTSQGGDEFPDTSSVKTKLRRALVRRAVDGVLGRLGTLGERAVHAFMTGWLALHKKRLERKAGHHLEPVDVFYRTVQGDRFRTGNWWGNDTCWRCALDINKILFYGTLDGRLGAEPARRYFSLIDGIVGGDEDGPMAPTPRPEGVLVAGNDPISVDVVATQIMGFDPDLIRDQKRGRLLERYRLTDDAAPIRVHSNWPAWQGQIAAGSDLGFRPHFAWAEYMRRVG